MRTVLISLPDGTQSQYYEDQLRTLWQQGAIRQEALYWIEGMPAWRPLAELIPWTSAQFPAATPTYESASLPIQPAYQPLNYQQPSYGSTTPGPYSIQAAPKKPTSLFVKDPTNLTTTLKVLLWTIVGFNGVLLLLATIRLMTGFGYSTLNQSYALLQESIFTVLTSLIAMSGFVVWLIAAVHFCKWIHRANTNVRGLGAHGLEFTPEWAVGYLFVPIVGFLRPYHAMSEIWKASRSPEQWKTEPVSNAVGAWWLLFLFWLFGFLVAAYLTQSGQTIEDQHTALIATIIEHALAILSAIAAVNLVTKIYQFQYEFVCRQS